jgi:hypothetical protein
MSRLIWIALAAMVVVGVAGMLGSERWVAESAALALVGMAIALRRLTWGR